MHRPRRTGVPGPLSTKAVNAEHPLPNVEGEYKVDARRLIRSRGIDDRWRRIDRRRVVAIGLIPTVVAAGLMPAAVSAFISAEGRGDGYAADHRGEDEGHHDLADCQTKLSGCFS